MIGYLLAIMMAIISMLLANEADVYTHVKCQNLQYQSQRASMTAAPRNVEMRPMSRYAKESHVVGGRLVKPRPKMEIKNVAQETTDEIIKLATAVVEGRDLGCQYTYDQLGRLPYVSGSGIMRQGCHSGQRKLLLTEIEFLSSCGGGAELVIYAGSAPCEKLPVLLALYPHLKFLLVDPNFHMFAAPEPPVYVYQAIDRVSKDTITNVRQDLRLAERRNLSTVDQKRLANARLVDHPPIYKQTYTADMSAADPAEMRRIQAEFEATNYKTLISDLIGGKDRVFIIQDYMTEALCALIATSRAAAGTPKTCFISDLRSNFFGDAPVDLDYIWNDALQLMFLKQLKPSWSMLKFHPPYMDYKRGMPLIEAMLAGETTPAILPVIRADLETVKTKYGLDMVAVYMARDHMHRYFAATTIWLQAWGPTSTSEARLIISAADIDKPWATYDARLWDERFTYNKLTRGYGFFGAFFNKIKGRRDLAAEYDGCFDCALEMMILLNYSYRRADEADASIDIVRLASLLEKKETQDTLLRLRRQVDSVVIASPYAKCIFHGQLVRPIKTPLYYVTKTAGITQAHWDAAAGAVVSKKLDPSGSADIHMSVGRNIQVDPGDWTKFWNRIAKGRALHDGGDGGD